MKVARRAFAFIAAVVATIAILFPATPAHAGTGGTNGGYPTLVGCHYYGAGLWHVALASSTYADPFLVSWVAGSTVTGYLSLRGCYPDVEWGQYPNTSYGTRLIVLRNTFGGWVNCGDYGNFTTGTSKSQAHLDYGGLPNFPQFPCHYVNWAAGQTYISGHWSSIVNPSGALYDPGGWGDVVNFGYFV